MNELPILLNDTWRFFSTNIWGIWNRLFPIIIPVSLAFALLPGDKSSEGSFSLGVLAIIFFLYPIIQATTIFYISSVINGESFSRKTCYRLAVKFWVPLFSLYIMAVLAVSAGLMLLVIPGLIVLARLMFSEFYCLLYKQEALEAFKLSWENTREYQWVLMLGMLIIVVATALPVIALDKIAETLGVWRSFFTFISGVIEYMLGSLVAIFAYRVFSFHIDKHDKYA